MKKIVLFLIFIVLICMLTACRYSNELIWVVPEFYLPNENIVEILNDKLANMGYDYRVRFIGIKDEDDKTYTDIIKEKMNSGEKMDIIFSGSPNSLEHDNYNSAYYRFAVEGIFEPLGEFINTDAGKKLFEAFPQSHIDAMTIEEEVYGVNGSLTTMSTDNFLLLNEESANILWDSEKIYSLIEVCDLLNHNSNYKTKLPIKFSSQHIPYYYFTNCTQVTDCLYINNNNEIISVLNDSKYINFLIKCVEMHNNGIIAATKEEQQAINSYISFEDYIGGYELSKSFNKSKINNPYLMIPLENENYIRFSNIGTGICRTSTKKEKAFELLSLCFSNQEINNLLVFGEENMDYTLNDSVPTNTNGYENVRIFAFGNRLICYPIKYETMYKYEDYLAAYSNASIPDCMSFVFDDSSIKEKVVVTNQIINDFYNSILNEGITTDIAETLVKDYKTLLDENGLQEILSELIKQYTDFLSQKGE